MNRKLIALLIFAAFAAIPALAVPPGKSIEFTGSAMGKVTMDGQVHKDADFTCKDCHNAELFPKMKQGTVKITMADIYGRKLCGYCHDGTKAFAAQGNCNRCHVK